MGNFLATAVQELEPPRTGVVGNEAPLHCLPYKPRRWSIRIGKNISAQVRLLTWLAQVVVVLAAENEPRAARDPENIPRAKRGRAGYYLAIVERWRGVSEADKRFCAAAFRVLESQPDASYADLAADGEVATLLQKDQRLLLGGPMLGAVSSEGARVWVRTARPAKVEIAVKTDGTEKTFGPVTTSRETDLAAVVTVTGLKPGGSYPYDVLIDGQRVTPPHEAAITPVATDARQARIAFGADYHVGGLGNLKLAEAILQRRPAALLLLGDIAVQDEGRHRGNMRCGYLARDISPAWRKLVANIPVYATWDDHDYLGNDQFGLPRGYSEQDRRHVWEVFRHAWNNPSYGLGEQGGGLFFRTRIGPCDVIMLDTRYFRSRGNFLGTEQYKWLEDQLLQCNGPFVIISSGTMWSDYVSGGKDSWGVYDPQGRERIFSLIEKHRIGGVLLISGDRHGARGFRIPRPSGFNFYEFEVGCLGRQGGPPISDPAWKNVQLFGVEKVAAFGEFAFDAARDDPTVTFRLIDEDGATRYEVTITRSQLTPPQ